LIILDKIKSFFVRAAKVAFNIIPVGISGRPIFKKPTFRVNAKFGYNKNEVIYACINKKGDSMSQVDMDVFNERDEKLDNHPLEILMTNPNPHMTEFEMYKRLIIDLDLSGNAYLEKVRSNSGQVVQLWRLRPDWVKPIPSAETYIAGYQYCPEGSTQKVILPPEDIIVFKLFDPINEYCGLAPVSVAARIGDVDSGGVDYLKNFFDHGGMPAGFLKTTSFLKEGQADQIANDWQERYGGPNNWTKPAILNADADYVKVGSGIEDLATDKVDAKTISRICMVLKVNPILIGAAHGLAKATFNNYATARRSFWREGLQPQMKAMQDTFNNSLAVEWTGVTLKWDFSNVPALQEDKDKLWKRAGSALAGGGVTVNEYRRLIGLEDVSDGDIFLRRQVLEVGAESEEKCSCGGDHKKEDHQHVIINDPFILSKKQLEDVRALMKNLNDRIKSSEQSEFVLSKSQAEHFLPLIKAFESKVSTPDDEADRITRENATTEDVQKFFVGQSRRIMQNVERKDSPLVLELIKINYNPEPMHESKEIREEWVDDQIIEAFKVLDKEFWEKEDKLFNESTMFPALLLSSQISVENTIAAFQEAFQIGIPIDLANRETAKWARKYSAQLVKGINRTTRNSVAEAVAAWVETDLPRSALVDELSPLFGDTRSRLIGRTETTKAFFEGNRITWRTSGIVKEFRWRTTESACPICTPLEGETFPLNSAGPPDRSHPNCNCFTEAVIDQESIDRTTEGA
jgi:HK97 family phage portal protein